MNHVEGTVYLELFLLNDKHIRENQVVLKLGFSFHFWVIYNEYKVKKCRWNSVCSILKSMRVFHYSQIVPVVFRFIGVTVICRNMSRTDRLQPPHTPNLLLSKSLCITQTCRASLHNMSACWHVFPRWHVLHDVHCSSHLSRSVFCCVFFFSLAAVSSVRKTGATVKASHCRQMLFSIWHDASSRSHFHCDCRAPSESIDNPCQALAPPTGAGTAS